MKDIITVSGHIKYENTFGQNNLRNVYYLKLSQDSLPIYQKTKQQNKKVKYVETITQIFCPFMWAIAIYAMSGGRCDFWALLVTILDFAGGAALQAVRECPWCH